MRGVEWEKDILGNSKSTAVVKKVVTVRRGRYSYNKVYCRLPDDVLSFGSCCVSLHKIQL